MENVINQNQSTSLKENLKLKKEKEFVTKWMILIAGIIISGILTLFSYNPWIYIISIVFLGIVAVLVTKFDLLHPFTWYIPFFVLYSISTPILSLAGVNEDYGYHLEALFLNWLAMVSFLLTVGPQSRTVSIKKTPFKNMSLILKAIFITTLLLTFLHVAEIFAKGIDSKGGIQLANLTFGFFEIAYPILLITFALLFAKSLMIDKKIPWYFLIFVFVWVTVSFSVTGERDLVLKVLWISIILIHVLYKKIPKYLILVSGFIGLFSIPILGQLKNIATNGFEKIVVSDYFFQIISSEFHSAGRNLQYLLSQQYYSWNYFSGQTLIWDIKRAFFPEFLYPSGLNPGSWFNQTFFPHVVERGQGRGFTLIGEGYMNFGFIGVILWFILLGFFVKILYKKGTGSIIWLVIYIVSMPLLVYLTRGDFSVLLTQFSKHIVLPIIIIFMVKIFFDNLKRIKI